VTERKQQSQDELVRKIVQAGLHLPDLAPARRRPPEFCRRREQADHMSRILRRFQAFKPGDKLTTVSLSHKLNLAIYVTVFKEALT
jgi:hypothetical protein